MTRSFKHMLAFAVALLLCPSAQAAQTKLPGEEFDFTPHKALYQVELQSARSGSQIINIEGQMYYEWNYDCTAWTLKHRFNVLYEYADSPAMRITSDFSNFESFDGTTLDFSAVRKQNGKQYEEIRGRASTPPNALGEAIYNQPSGVLQELPAGTMYPMAHTLNTIKHIKEGKKFFNAIVFDGSDEEGPVEINAFIGKPVDGYAAIKDKTRALDESLLQGPAQQIQLAFFPLSNREEKAEYEMNLTLHHNSIISNMRIDYDDFSVSQRLIAIEPINQTQAEKSCQ